MDTQAQNQGFEVQEDDIEVAIRQPGQDSGRTTADPESGEVVPHHRQGQTSPPHRLPADGTLLDQGEHTTQVRFRSLFFRYDHFM